MKYWLFLLLMGIIFPTLSQDGNSKNVDNTEVVGDSIRPHSVKKAAIFSAVIPGSGQIYNHIAMPKGKKKAYWKVPLIYAGLGVSTYYAIVNNRIQRELKLEYTNRVENGVVSDTYSNYDNAGVLQLYRQKLNQRDLFFLGMGLVYLIQVADAAVEAHFVNFDVSSDLSLRVRPTVMQSMYITPTIGVSLQLKFK